MSRLPTRGARPRIKPGIRVRIRRPWKGYPVGAVIEPPGTLRSVLVQHGIADVVEETAPVDEVVVEAVAPEAEPEQAAEPESGTDREEIEKPKRRGRPRKGDSE